MSRPDTKAIRARADAATEGPWGCDDGHVFCRPLADERFAAVRLKMDDPSSTITTDRDPSESIATCDSANSWFDANEQFIAAARADVPALCDRVEALETALHEIACDAHELTGLAYATNIPIRDRLRGINARARAALEGREA